ncbi:hypothetical protein lbkm_2830 [Lachnospiraceae bacterium KM106-2]|nr:hypothetical protein lbkm_2830 [Lachnospiraceae bacterium KM106-2]
MLINGFIYGAEAKKGEFRTEEALQSQQSLIELGVNWVCIPIKIQQKRYNATEILFDYNEDVTDKDIEFIVKRFHDQGVKVCLKPTISCMDGVWHGFIDFPDQLVGGTDEYWKRWFRSYTNFIRHYAEIAQDSGCEMLCVGSELVGTERKERYWRSLLDEVRTIYDGPLVYACDFKKSKELRWLDGVDYVGINEYDPVAKYPGDTMENMQSEWERIAEKVEEKSKLLKKPVLFMESGCRSARGCAKFPADTTHMQYPFDEDEQANFYESCLEVFMKKEWFAGIFFKEWNTKIYQSKAAASEDKSYNVHKKLSEKVIRKWFKKEA